MRKPEYYRLVGDKTEPCELEDFVRDFAHEGRHVLRRTIGSVMVSTIFLGLNHNHGDGEPILFETMIFGGPHDQYQRRFSTYSKAIAGHFEAVALVESSRGVSSAVKRFFRNILTPRVNRVE